MQQLPEEITRGKLHFLENDEAMASLSSSAVRSAIAEQSESAASMVPTSLRAFLLEQGLYQ